MSNPTMADDTAAGTGRKQDQATKRRYQFYTDQHGRRWGAVVEKSTGEPCGLLERQQWSAPLIPDDKYLSVNPLTNKLNIDYQSWIGDIHEANAAWDLLLRENAIHLYGQGAVSQALKDPQPELLDRVGPRPKQQRGPIEAAMAGNKWILGLSNAKPAWASEFYPDVMEAEAAPFAIMGNYPDVEAESDYPKWSGPHKGWTLSDDSALERLEGEDKEAYKARAAQAELALHGE